MKTNLINPVEEELLKRVDAILGTEFGASRTLLFDPLHATHFNNPKKEIAHFHDELLVDVARFLSGENTAKNPFTLAET